MLGIVAATASLYGAIEEARYQRLRGLYAERDALTKETSLTETTIFDMKRYAQVMKEIKKNTRDESLYGYQYAPVTT